MKQTFLGIGKDNIRWISLLTVLTIFLAVGFGCAGSGNYGRLQRDEDVDKAFKTYQFPPDHKYYYTGPDGRPDAIMGIKNEYTLETTQWKPIKSSDGTLKKGIDSINFHHSTRVRNYPYGFFILGPEGDRLGIWYSIWDWTTVIVKEDKRLQVFPPVVKDPSGSDEERDRMKFD